MKVFWSPEAISELQGIFEFISHHNPAAADRVKMAIVQASQRLGQYPALGRMTQRNGIRLWPITGLPYLLTYRVSDQRIEIGKVLDGRMDREADLR